MLADSTSALLDLRQHVEIALRLADRLRLHAVAAKLASAHADLDGDVGPWSIEEIDRAVVEELLRIDAAAIISDPASA